MTIPSANPLAYEGVSATNPAQSIVSNRNPTSADIAYPIDTFWINSANNSAWCLTSVSLGASVWTELGTGSVGNILTITGDTGGAEVPLAGNFNIKGTANQVTVAGSANTETISLIGPYTPATYTAHGVLVGEGTSSIVALTVGTNGQVLTGATGADPAFAALGTNSGLTAHGVLLGEGNSAIVAAAVGTSGQVLTGNTAADPAFAAIGTNSALTAHGVLLAEGTGPFVATTAGTTGQVLISATGADPAFGALGVNSGLTVHGVLLGENNSAIVATTAGTTGQVLIGSTGADPAFGALGVNSGLTVHGVLLGENNSAIVATTAGTTGQVLIGSTGADPAFGALGVNSGLTVHGVLLGENNSAIAATTAGSNGQVLLGSTGADPAFGTLTTSTGVTFTTGAAALAVNVASGGFKVNAASTGVALVAQNSYTVTQAAQTSFSLPATAAVGDMFLVASGLGNTGGWLITQGAGQEIWSGTSHTTNGVTGTLAGDIHTSVLLMCTIANVEFIVLGNTTGYTFT